MARNLDFVDRPGGRKIHVDEVPVVGGIAMFIGLSIGISLLPDAVRPPVSYLSLGLVFVVMGVLDDRLALSPQLRLLVQAGAALSMVIFGSLNVHYIGSPFGFGQIIFEPWAAAVLTLVLVVGAVNALNMVDGIDGLAGSLGLIALMGVGYTAIEGSDAVVLGVALALGGSLVGFLIFNWPLHVNRRIRTFMGDAGSMLIGFSLSWCLVALSQNPSTPIAPVSLLWFVAIPIFDMVSTAAGRVLRGQSPVSADTTHFHHMLLHRGMSSRQVLLVLVALALFWAVFGFALEAWWGAPQWVSLLSFLAAGVVTDRLIRRGARVPAV